MKNQNDLIFSVVSLVIGLVLAIVFLATEPQVTKPADPATVDTAAPKLPSGDVVYGNSLPGATGAAAGGGFGGGMPGAMGPMSGPGMAAASMGGGGRKPSAGGPPATHMAHAGG